MIRVEITSKDKLIKKITIKGHAMYDDIGKDIVCAATSSLVISTINNILSINPNAIDYDKNSEGINITIKLQDNIVNILINNMITYLNELMKSYKENIKVISKEE